MSKRIGNLGEELALIFLRRRGFKLIAKNFRSEYGEIDLVMRRGSQMHFVEVKARDVASKVFGRESVDQIKMERIWDTAEEFFCRFPCYAQLPWQVDVVEARLNYRRRIAQIEAFWDF